MKEIKMGTFTYNNEDYNFNFSTSLSAYEKLSFVKTVVNNLVDDKGYDVIVRDLIFDFAIVESFTNVDTSFINAKDDSGNNIAPIILVEHFLENSNIIDIVKANIEDGLLDELNRAVDLNIQYITGIIPSPINESVAKLVSAIEKKIVDVDLDIVMDMAKKLSNMTEDFTVENVVNAYMDSDTHKENVVEIEKAKKKRSTKKE